MFAHEKLQVYAKALRFAAGAVAWVNVGQATRNRKPFAQSVESVVANLAEAARQRGPSRLRSADYALGSSLECAGCLDIAERKGLLTQAQVSLRKKRSYARSQRCW